MDKEGQPRWIIFKLYNIIIKSANVDKGGGNTLIHKMWIKRCFFKTPPLRNFCHGNNVDFLYLLSICLFLCFPIYGVSWIFFICCLFIPNIVHKKLYTKKNILIIKKCYLLNNFWRIVNIMQVLVTSVPLSANLSMGMSAMIWAHSLNLLVGFEWG